MEKYLYEDLNNLETKHWWHVAKRKTVMTLISKFAMKKKNKIVDIGCGTGQNLKAFKVFGQVWGIDNSKEAIAFCKNKNLENVFLGNSYQTNLPSSSFDIVTLLDVLEHTDEIDTLSEISRILKPGGLLIISVPAFSWLWSKWDKVLHHKRRYSKETLRLVLLKNKYTVIKLSYLYSFLVLPALVIRTIKSFIFKSYYPSDFKIINPVINLFFKRMSDIERKIFLNFNLPFGTSLICVAKLNRNF